VKKTIAGFLLGLVLALSLTFLAGENPWHIGGILFKSAFGSMYDLGLTLFYTTPLIFCGLSVAVAFHAGLFNIGAEGQLTVATLAAAAVGVFLPNLPFPIAPLLALVAALFTGALWGFIAGWLRAVRGSHEVIVTIMLNFIAAGISSWFILHVIPNPQSQNPESALVGPGYMLKDYDFVAKLFPDTPVSMALIIAILTAIGVWILLWKTTFGYELRAVGYNPEAAARAGISDKKMKILAMCLAGALAGFVALGEVMGSTGQFKIGFSADYGFIGIAVALLAQNNPLGIIFAAFLMGALHKGASDLDLETSTITRDFSKIIQSLIILGVAAHGLWTWRRRDQA
jgi:ABC-type uncharacterized transport system permease subunit